MPARHTASRLCLLLPSHWFYEDFLRPLNPSLPSLSLRRFSAQLLHTSARSVPLIQRYVAGAAGAAGDAALQLAFEEFMRYKTRVPVCGVVLVNRTWDKVSLLRGDKRRFWAERSAEGPTVGTRLGSGQARWPACNSVAEQVLGALPWPSRFSSSALGCCVRGAGRLLPRCSAQALPAALYTNATLLLPPLCSCPSRSACSSKAGSLPPPGASPRARSTRTKASATVPCARCWRRRALTAATCCRARAATTWT
jgi:hypothetical protein